MAFLSTENLVRSSSTASSNYESFLMLKSCWKHSSKRTKLDSRRRIFFFKYNKVKRDQNEFSGSLSSGSFASSPSTPPFGWLLICPVQPQKMFSLFVSFVIVNSNYVFFCQLFSSSHCFLAITKTFLLRFFPFASPFTVLPNFPVNWSHTAVLVRCQPLRYRSHVSLISGSLSCRWWKSLFDFEPETSPRANILMTRKPYSRCLLTCDYEFDGCSWLEAAMSSFW